MEYFLVVSYLSLLFYKYDLRGNFRFKNFNINVVFWMLVFLAGFRYRVGPDTISYSLLFEFSNVPLSDLNFESFISTKYQPFWILLTSFCKSYLNFVWLQLIVAFIANSCYFYFFKKSTTKIFTAILIYFLLDYFYFNYDLMRESISVGLFLVALIKLNEKKYKSYYLLVLAAFLFHFFAFICFFIPLFLSQRINKPLKIIIGFLLFTLILTYSSATSEINSLLGLLNLSHDLSSFIQFDSAEISALGYFWNFLRIIPVFFIILFYSGKRKMSHLLLPKRIVLSLSYLYIYIVLIRIFAIPYIERLLNYVIMIIHLIHISIAFDLARIYFKNSSRFIIIMFFIFSSFFFYIAPFLKIHPLYGVRYYKIYYPYYSIFSEKKDEDRETIIYKTGKE